MASAEVQDLLKRHPSLAFDVDKQKVTCCLTKHEMPASVAAIETYVQGKRFRSASQMHTYDYGQHKPHIVPSSKKKHLHELFCTLTLRHIGKTPQDVERHVKGKRFKKALARWMKCQETGEKFVPRQGGRKPATQSTSSDSDSAKRGDSFWSADSDDEGVVDNDDMSDLYPAEDFEDEADEEEEDDPTENTPPVVAATNSSRASPDSDSDYDMSVLHTQRDQETETKASSPHSSSSSQFTKKTGKKKKMKKRQAVAVENGCAKKTKKPRIT